MMFSYLAGPDDIAFDLRRRTYRQRAGFVWLPRTRSGTLDDITGFLIHQGDSRRGRALCHMSLILDRPNRRWKWRSLLLDYPQVGIFDSPEAARRQAREIASQLATPCRIFRGTTWGFAEEQH